MGSAKSCCDKLWGRGGRPLEETLIEGERPDDVQEMLVEDMDEARRESRLVSVQTEFQRFRELKVLGKGGFGKVLLVMDQTSGGLFAMKVISKKFIEERNQRFHTKEERRLLAALSSPFVVRLHYAYQSPSRLYLVMDFMQGGELFFHLRREKRFNEERARLYSAQLLLAIQYLHSQGVIYRDLKPQNILMGKDGYLKVTDFGLSKAIVGDQKTFTYCGTPQYLAPQIFLEQGHGKSADWWSFGALLYEMVAGAPPFYSKDQTKMFRNRITRPIQMKEYFSANLRDILRKLLQINPSKRLGAKGAFELKEHPFYAGLQFGRLLRKDYKMEFKPKLEGEQDLRYFDAVFTSQQIKHTQEDPKYEAMRYSSYTYRSGNEVELARLS